MKLTEDRLRRIIREQAAELLSEQEYSTYEDLPPNVQEGLSTLGLPSTNADHSYERNARGNISVTVDYFSEFFEHNVKAIQRASQYGLTKLQHTGDGEVVYRFKAI